MKYLLKIATIIAVAVATYYSLNAIGFGISPDFMYFMAICAIALASLNSFRVWLVKKNQG